MDRIELSGPASKLSVKTSSDCPSFSKTWVFAIHMERDRDGNIFAKHKSGTHDLAYDLLVDVQINTTAQRHAAVPERSYWNTLAWYAPEEENE